MNRRQFLLGGLSSAGAVLVGGALVEARVLPGRALLHRQLGGCGASLDPPAAGAGARVNGQLASRARRTTVDYTVAYPPGSGPGERLPVCVALHGRDADHRWPLDGLHADRFLAEADPPAPFALTTVDGGPAVNWHRRASGDDPLAMVTDELLPTLAGAGLDIARVGVIGWSLGGAGALALADRLGPGGCAAVVAASPAIWTDADDVAPGTYDDDADFAANRVDRLGPELRGIPMWIDCGDLDPFVDAVAAFRLTLDPPPAGAVLPGCHDGALWTRRLPLQLAFLAQHLTGATRRG